jgi:hypothetical protein
MSLSLLIHLNPNSFSHSPNGITQTNSSIIFIGSGSSFHKINLYF